MYIVYKIAAACDKGMYCFFFSVFSLLSNVGCKAGDTGATDLGALVIGS